MRRNQTGWRSSEHLLPFFTVCSTKDCVFCLDQGLVILGGNLMFFGASIHAVYRQTMTKWAKFNFYVVQLQRVDQFLLGQKPLKIVSPIFSFQIESKTVSLSIQTT